MASVELNKIGETSFTIEWLKKEIVKRKKLTEQDEVRLESFKVTDLTTAMGFLSRIIRVHLYWANNRHGTLPNSVILKVPGMTGANRNMANLPWTEQERQAMMQNAKGGLSELGFLITAHSNEMAFYDLFPARCDSGPMLALPLPEIYSARHMDPEKGVEGVLVMQDMTSDTRIVSLSDGMTLPQIEKIVDKLAVLHVRSVHSNQEWLHGFKTDDRAVNEFPSMMLRVAMMLKRLRPQWFQRLDNVAHMFTGEFMQSAVASFSQLGMQPVLVHGDLWTSNILWKSPTTDSDCNRDKLAGIIDWQMAHAGNCCEDLARLLVSSVQPQLRRQHTQYLLNFYHHRLCLYYKNNKNNEAKEEELFSLEQIKRAYEAVLPVAMVHYLFGAPMYANMDEIVGTSGTDDRAEKQDSILIRAKMVVDDVLQLTRGSLC